MIKFRFYIEINSVKAEIKEPKNFKDVESNIKRDLNAHGVFFEYTSESLKLGFGWLCGGQQLEDEYIKFGTNAEVYYIVEQLINESWTQIYRGKIDYESRAIDENFFNCSINRIDTLDKLRDRIDVKSKINTGQSLNGTNIDSYDTETVQVVGKRIRTISKWEINPDLAVYDTDDPDSTASTSKFIPPWRPIITNLYTPQSTLGYDPDQANWVSNLPPESRRTAAFFYAGLPGQLVGNNAERWIKLKVKLRVRVSNPDNPESFNHRIDTKIERYATSLSIDEIDGIFYKERNDPYAFQSDTWHTIEFEKESYLLPHYSLTYVMRFNEDSPQTRIVIEFDSDNSYIEITEDVRNEASTLETISAYQLLRSTSEFILDDNNKVNSSFFESGCGSDFNFFNGYLARQISGRPWEISFKKLIQSYKAMFGVGYGVESNQVAVRPLKDFYGEYEIMNVGQGNNWSEEPISELLFNKVEIGYETYADDEETEDTLDDIHTEHQYKTPLKNVVDDYELKSSIIASPFIFEKTRTQLFKSRPSEAYKHDEKTFVLSRGDFKTGQVSYDLHLLGVANYDDENRNRIQVIIPNEDNLNVTMRDVFKSRLNTADDITIFVIDEDYRLYDSGWSFSKEYTLDEIVYFDDYQEGDLFTQYNTVFYLNGDQFPTDRSIDVKVIRFTFTYNYTGRFPESDENFSVVENVIDPETFYNLRLSPKRMLMNNGYLLNASMGYQDISQNYINTRAAINGEVNLKLSASDSCEIGDKNYIEVKENDDISIEECYSGERRFVPNMLSFESNLCFEDIEIVRKAHQNQLTGSDENKNYGYISVIDFNGNTRSGYIKNMKYNIATGNCKFELIEKFSPFSGNDFDPEWFNA